MNLFCTKGVISLTECQELLYAYTGPSPFAYGTRTRAVLENIQRPYQYFYLNNPRVNEYIKSGSKDPNEINTTGPSSGFHEKSVREFAREWKLRNVPAFHNFKHWTESKLPRIPYADLSTGRQTYSFIQKRNIPAPMALEETIEFLELNLKRKIGPSLLSYCQAILDVLSLEETKFTKKIGTKEKAWEWTDENEERDSDDEPTMREVTVVKTRKVELTFTRKELWDEMRSLNTMWKDKERGRLNRRTIATPSMLVRGFVKLVEDAAKEILIKIRSSGVPVGGEEKLAKLHAKLFSIHGKVTGELSGDQEKFNECLDPDAMRIMWYEFMKDDHPEWVQKLFQIPFCVFKAKRANLGEGLMYSNNKEDKRVRFGIYPSEFDNVRPLLNKDPVQLQREDDMREELSRLKKSNKKLWRMKRETEPYKDLHRMDKNQWIDCSLGMFMGMFNLSATLLSLIAADYKCKGEHVESSDDFIHFFQCDSEEQLFKEAETLRLRQKMVGINFSPSKCLLIIPAGIGEFNSKYHHGDFVGNVATELPSLVPNGKNPMVDLTMGHNVIKHSLNTFQMLPPTANMALKLFYSNYQYLYWVKGVTKRTRFLNDCDIPRLLTNQGAKPIHSISTLHLEEISFRKRLGLITEEQAGKIIHPDNPLTTKLELSTTLRVGSKMPVDMDIASVGSVFNYEFSRNRTILQSADICSLEKEKGYQGIVKLIERCCPEMHVYAMRIPGSVEDVLKSRIEALITSAEIHEAGKRELFNMLEESDSE